MPRRSRRPVVLALAFAAGAALSPSEGRGQVAPDATGTGAGYQVYRFTDPEAADLRTLSLLTLPFATRVPLGDRLEIGLAGVYARGTLVRADGTEAVVSGPTDTQLSARLAVAGDRFVLSGLLSLPTGTETLSATEAAVAGAIASDLLPFRISNWGSGGGAGVSASGTHSFGDVGVGFGASYVVAREFEPVAEAGFAEYRPGAQLVLQAAADRNVGRSGKASLHLVYQHQGDDQLGGANLFRSGDRIQAIGSYAFRIARASSGIVYVGGQHRERGTALLEITRNAPSQYLLLGGVVMRLPLREGVASPSVSCRVLRSTDGVGQGYLCGAGARAEWPLGPLRVGPELRVDLGRVLVSEGRESDFRGLDVGLSIRF